MLDVKVQKKPGSFYILGFLLEIIVEIWQFEFFSYQNSVNLDHFSHEKNPLYWSEISFFRLNFCENLPIKKTLQEGT
jgi:hypothetical protein